jgi:wyosine [tRNA(Phe)-imidazoG37] synthetase (radical SAM superfamily)
VKYKYLFGPVPSRRLGISLGVDVVPYKVCTLGCVYCECGPSTKYTVERKPYYKAEDIFNELRNFLSEKPKLDYITFSGGGEPTLNSDIGKIVDYIKDSYPQYKIALLTNGSLLWREDVRNDIKKCDLIVPSLDAVTEDVYKKINKPAEEIKIEDIILGIKKIKEESAADIWLEVFIVPGINDTDEELAALKNIIMDIGPGKVQLNTLDRPGAEEWVKPASESRMNEIKEFLMPVKVEIVKTYEPKEGYSEYSKDLEENFLAVLRRRPCTVDDFADVFKIQKDVAMKYLHGLEKSGKIFSEKEDRGLFYRIKENGTEKKQH